MKAKDIKILYYYLRDKLNRPLVTVCLGVWGPHHARGISVCSNSDIPNKKEGRNYARGYMLKALGSRTNGEYVTEERCLEVLESVTSLHAGFQNVDLQSLYMYGLPKSAFMPGLSQYEKKLVEGTQ